MTIFQNLHIAFLYGDFSVVNESNIINLIANVLCILLEGSVSQNCDKSQ